MSIYFNFSIFFANNSCHTIRSNHAKHNVLRYVERCIKYQFDIVADKERKNKKQMSKPKLFLSGVKVTHPCEDELNSMP